MISDTVLCFCYVAMWCHNRTSHPHKFLSLRITCLTYFAIVCFESLYISLQIQTCSCRANQQFTYYALHKRKLVYRVKYASCRKVFQITIRKYRMNWMLRKTCLTTYNCAGCSETHNLTWYLHLCSFSKESAVCFSFVSFSTNYTSQ
jgi:hypothetical protein